MKLSVVIAAYNEINTIGEILSRVLEVDLRKEVIVVDDCSTDGRGRRNDTDLFILIQSSVSTCWNILSRMRQR